MITNFDSLKALHEEDRRHGSGATAAFLKFATAIFDSFPLIYQTAKRMNEEMETLRAADKSTAREQQLEHALRELIATIDLHTDCMDGSIDIATLDLYIENAEALLGEARCCLGLPPVGAGVMGYFVGTWIDAGQELPDADTTVMIRTINASEPVWLGYHDGERWMAVEGNPVEVEAWTDLPEDSARPLTEVEYREG